MGDVYHMPRMIGTGKGFRTELTARECEILKRMARGEETKSIAPDMGISTATVAGDLRSIREFYGAKNTLHAVVCAVSCGDV